MTTFQRKLGESGAKACLALISSRWPKTDGAHGWDKGLVAKFLDKVARMPITEMQATTALDALHDRVGQKPTAAALYDEVTAALKTVVDAETGANAITLPKLGREPTEVERAEVAFDQWRVYDRPEAMPGCTRLSDGRWVIAKFAKRMFTLARAVDPERWASCASAKVFGGGS